MEEKGFQADIVRRNKFRNQSGQFLTKKYFDSKYFN